MTDYSVLHMHLICALPQRVPTKVTDLFDDDLSLTHKELPYLKNLQLSSWFWVMIKQTVTISLQVCGISKKISWGERFSESTAAKRFSADLSLYYSSYLIARYSNKDYEEIVVVSKNSARTQTYTIKLREVFKIWIYIVCIRRSTFEI